MAMPIVMLMFDGIARIQKQKNIHTHPEHSKVKDLAGGPFIYSMNHWDLIYYFCLI